MMMKCPECGLDTEVIAAGTCPMPGLELIGHLNAPIDTRGAFNFNLKKPLPAFVTHYLERTHQSQ